MGKDVHGTIIKQEFHFYLLILMKLRLSVFQLSAMLLLTGAFFSGCTQTNSPTTSGQTYSDTFRDVDNLSPNQLYAFSVSGGSSGTVITAVSAYKTGTVRVFWTRASGDSSNVSVNAQTVSSPTPISGSIIWAPIYLTSMVRVYETADSSSSQPSGLVLGQTSHAASISGSEKDNIDLVLATDNSLKQIPFLSLIAADVQGSGINGGKATDIGNNAYQTKAGLVGNKFTTDIAGLVPTQSGNRINSFDIPGNISDSSSIILLMRTSDGHYARVEIIPQPAVGGNNYLWGDTNPGGKPSYRFIDVNVTYQTIFDGGYVGRPIETKRGTNTPKTGKLTIVHE
jgi:hypothetical protein